MLGKLSKGARVGLFWVPAAAYMALIFYLSSRPRPPLPEIFLFPFDPQRYILHFFEFAILGLLLARLVLVEKKMLGKRMVFVAALFTLLYAMTDEIHQLFVPGRAPSFGDLIFDGLGGAFGATVYALSYKIEAAILRGLKLI